MRGFMNVDQNDASARFFRSEEQFELVAMSFHFYLHRTRTFKKAKKVFKDIFYLKMVNSKLDKGEITMIICDKIYLRKIKIKNVFLNLNFQILST
jgi:hypothetical protein